MPRIVSVDDETFTLPPVVKVANANLPATLQPAALTATIDTVAKPLIDYSLIPEIPDMMWSSWVWPLAMNDTRQGHTLVGGISSSGILRRAKINNTTGRFETVEMGKLPPDDHGAPAVYTFPGTNGNDASGGRPDVHVWVGHTTETVVHVRRSVWAGGQSLQDEITITFPQVVTYAQVQQNALTGELHLMVRVDDNPSSWYHCKSTNYGGTWSAPALFMTGVGRNYVLMRPSVGSGSGVRIATYGHPTQSTERRIFVGAIAWTSGAVTKGQAGIPSVAMGTLDTNSFAQTDFQAVYTPPAGKIARLVDMSQRGANLAMLIIEWTEGVDSDAAFYYLQANGTTTMTRTYVAPAGDVIGYDLPKHYHGLGCFSHPDTGNEFYIVTNDAGADWRLEKVKITDAGGTTFTRHEVYRAPGGSKIGRPVIPYKARVTTAPGAFSPTATAVGLVLLRIHYYGQEFYDYQSSAVVLPSSMLDAV